MNKEHIKFMLEEIFEEVRFEFRFLGHDGHYTEEQKQFAFDKIDAVGIRATSRLLKIPRRTLQRWCLKHDVFVKPCPDWVVPWAERRRERREFWARRGFV